MAALLTQFDLDDFAATLAEGTHFSAHLVRLIKKADPENRARLRLAFPDHVKAVELFDLGSGAGRLWRCPRCGALNSIFPDREAYPATCMGCLERTEPGR